MAVKRRIWIINAKFQWFVVAYTVIISVLTTLVSGYLRRVDGQIPPWQSMLLLAGFNVFVVVLAMWTSHRMAGPIYRLQRELRDVAAGKKLGKIFFRKWDHFPELNDAYNEFVESQEKKTKPNGFSLTELLLVVAIAAAMVAISAPSLLSPKDSYTFKADVSRMQDLLLSARNAAFTHGECAIVTINDAQNISFKSYAIPAPCTGPTGVSDVTMSLHLANANVAQFQTTAGPSPTLTFTPRGGTTAPSVASIAVTATSVAQNVKTIIVYPAIGQVRLQ